MTVTEKSPVDNEARFQAAVARAKAEAMELSPPLRDASLADIEFAVAAWGDGDHYTDVNDAVDAVLGYVLFPVEELAEGPQLTASHYMPRYVQSLAVEIVALRRRLDEVTA